LEFSQAFPIAIIDEDYKGKSAAGRGMRQLAAAIEKEGYRVVAGVETDIHGLRFEPAAGGRRCLVDCIAQGAET
jgi:hypothetical protein